MGDQIERFYKSEKWIHARKKALARDGYRCRECRRYGRKDKDGLPIAAEVVHHIIAVEDDWSKRLELSNMESLCRACHNKRHPEKGCPPGARQKNFYSP